MIEIVNDLDKYYSSLEYPTEEKETRIKEFINKLFLGDKKVNVNIEKEIEELTSKLSNTTSKEEQMRILNRIAELEDSIK